MASLSDDEADDFFYDWRRWARPNQLEPSGNWFCWMILAGRGFGKTRTGVEWIRQHVEGPSPLIAPPGGISRIAMIAETAADGRDVMVEGESGMLAVSPDKYRPLYEPSKRRLTWPNGCQASLYSAEDPDQLRGPQHHLAWGDELAKWQYADDVWSNLLFGMRLGNNPRVCVTTTPKPLRLIRDLIKSPSTFVTSGSTYENRSNLPETFLNQIISKYEGTRIGRQELMAELLDDVPGALWQRSAIDALRVKVRPDLKRIIVAVDPAVTSGEDSDETGIIVVGQGADQRGYVLDDQTCRESPDRWARKAVAAYYRHEADLIVAEVNNGGDLVERVIRTVDPNIPFKAVRASRGKYTRAEPIAALYEQGKISHLGTFGALEDQMCAFTPEGTPGESPDRVDALVWGLHELMIASRGGATSTQLRI